MKELLRSTDLTIIAFATARQDADDTIALAISDEWFSLVAQSEEEEEEEEAEEEAASEEESVYSQWEIDT